MTFNSSPEKNGRRKCSFTRSTHSTIRTNKSSYPPTARLAKYRLLKSDCIHGSNGDLSPIFSLRTLKRKLQSSRKRPSGKTLVCRITLLCISPAKLDRIFENWKDP